MRLQEKALKANGLSRACGKCKLGMRRCTPEIAEVCKNAFLEDWGECTNAVAWCYITDIIPEGGLLCVR